MPDLVTAGETDPAFGSVQERTVDHHLFFFDPGGSQDIGNSKEFFKIVELDSKYRGIFPL